MKEFIIGQNDCGNRLDRFLLKVTVGMPHSLLYKKIRTKKIKVNRRRAEPGQLLCQGDTVQCFLPPDFFREIQEHFLSLVPDIRIVYEDRDLIVADKKEGMSCHADETQRVATLIDHIKAYLVQSGEYDPARENAFAPALCHRIDRNTSGLVIAAKNAEALRAMNELIREHRIEKEYLALCHGKVTKKEKKTVYLKKDEEKNRVRVVSSPREGYLTAITEYEPLSYRAADDVTLLRVRLHTGRTHQIRATLAFFSHPLVGDAKYGTDKKHPLFAHQALRAHAITLRPEKNSYFSHLDGLKIQAQSDPRFCLNS